MFADQQTNGRSDESSALDELPAAEVGLQLELHKEDTTTTTTTTRRRRRTTPTAAVNGEEKEGQGRKPLRGRRKEAPKTVIAVATKSTTAADERQQLLVKEERGEEEEEEDDDDGDQDEDEEEEGGEEELESDRDNIRLLQRIARGTSKLAAIASQHRRHHHHHHHLNKAGSVSSSSLPLQTPRLIGDEDDAAAATAEVGGARLRPEKWLDARRSYWGSSIINNNKDSAGEDGIRDTSGLSSSEPLIASGQHCLSNQPADSGIHLDGCQLTGKIEFGEANEALVAAESARPDHLSAGPEASLALICGQLLTLVCGLIVLLYLIDLANRGMTNLLSKILGGVGSERRRSLAAPGSESNRTQAAREDRGSSISGSRNLIPGSIMQSQSTSTLTLPRNSSPTFNAADGGGGGGSGSSSALTPPASSGSSHSRRSSRSSIHSVSAMLMSALTGGRTSNNNNISSNNNGRSIIAKNKEDTVILASASPTIIQKESTDSVVSTPGGVIGSPAPPVASPVVMQQQQQQQQHEVDQQQQAARQVVDAANMNGKAPAAPTKINYQSQYNLSTDRAHPLAAYLTAAQLKHQRPDHTIAVVAAAAAADPTKQQQQQLPTLSIQTPVPNAAAAVEQASSSHAPLNSSSTIRSVSNSDGASPKRTAAAADTTTISTSAGSTARRNEIIRATELLLNALNQGDYETYTQLCDPHMTSFEPENLGNLIDNMEYRRLCLDQARQLQLQHHLKDSRASSSSSAPASQTTSTTTTNHPQQQQQQHQPPATTTTTKQYSIILNPSVYLLGEDAASIAYTKLSQLIGDQQLISIEKSEETRVWHRKNGTKWLCVHLHRSVVETKTSCTGPQTSASLIRCIANQHELESVLAAASQQQHQQQQHQQAAANENPTGR